MIIIRFKEVDEDEHHILKTYYKKSIDVREILNHV